MLEILILFLYVLKRFCIINQEFDDSGDPEKHYEALLSLAKAGVEKGKV